MNRKQILALYDREMRIEIEFPEARKEVLPHVVRFVRPAPGMNFISYGWLTEATMDSVIQEQVAYFEPMGQPFEWQVLDRDKPPNLADRLEAAGFASDETYAVMVLDLTQVPPELLAPVAADVRLITTRDQLQEVIQVEEQVWGGDFGWMTKRLGDHLEVPGYLSAYVAYMEDQPAATGWTYFYPNSHFAGIWGGSTVPAYRRRGLYRTLLAIRVQEARRRRFRFLIVDTTPASRPILTRHGFQHLAWAQDLQWQGR